jgi:hypothetical protein
VAIAVQITNVRAHRTLGEQGSGEQGSGEQGKGGRSEPAVNLGLGRNNVSR